MYSLIDVDGNAFAVIGYVINAMKKENKSKEEIAAYKASAMIGNYDTLLSESIDMVDELNEDNY